MRPKVVPLINDFIAPTKTLCKRHLRLVILSGDYGIPAGGEKEALRGVINTLERILPRDQTNKAVLNFGNHPLPIYHLLTVH